MALKLNDLSVLAYANNFTLWHYKTIDSAITGTGYFNNAADIMRVGDMIFANVDTDGTPINKIYLVTGVSSGVVTVTVYS